MIIPIFNPQLSVQDDTNKLQCLFLPVANAPLQLRSEPPEIITRHRSVPQRFMSDGNENVLNVLLPGKIRRVFNFPTGQRDRVHVVITLITYMSGAFGKVYTPSSQAVLPYGKTGQEKHISLSCLRKEKKKEYRRTRSTFIWVRHNKRCKENKRSGSDSSLCCQTEPQTSPTCLRNDEQLHFLDGCVAIFNRNTRC